ncbi:uncharacterized protein LAJ45_01803 [Morchella importuna]|uniref:uncharacterized protein n=1 Tax=Morchella importuna TaxID=1174673 RepID=UPI001E8D62BA|nr:uncharacterized protein LAJ45_01803 [Morchella importuna]KAH8154036.1 hypothetical protein LAJ45_01803 [Morchella importuna]
MTQHQISNRREVNHGTTQTSTTKPGPPDRIHLLSRVAGTGLVLTLGLAESRLLALLCYYFKSSTELQGRKHRGRIGYVHDCR